MQSSAIFILNKQEKVINILNNVDSPNRNPFFDDILTQTLSTGADTYKFTTTFNKKNSRSITVGNKVAFMLDGKYMLFQIVSVNDVHGDNLEMEVYCESAGLSLINSVCRSQRIVSCDVRKFLEAILQDTEWNIGFVDMSLSNVFDLELETASVYSLLQNNIKKYDAEIRFRCEIVNGRISKKFIDVFRTRGKVSGKRFEFGKNVESISRQIDSSELFTALIGEGKNGLNFSDISLEDVPNKPEGQDFVFDQEAYNRYNQNGYHLMGVFKYETESKEELLRETYKKLQECKNPKIKYTVNVSLLGGDVEVGETVNIIDRFFEPPLLLQARVSKLEKSLSDNSNVRCELSNFVEVSSNINLELLNKVKDFVDNSITDRFPIGTDDIQDGAVTGQKIYENSITTDHLMAGVVTAEKVHAESIKANHIAANQVKAQHIEAGAIDATKIKADSIESEHIVANAIKSEHIDAESITSDKIQAGSIESQHIKANQIESGHIKSNSIDADKIQANSIESKHIKADAIKSEHIDANSVTSDKIQAGSVTADKIQAGAITAGSSIVAEGAIGSAQISSLEANKINTGTLDTSLVNIAGPDGNMEITGNQLLVNNKGKNRVIVGEYRNDEDETKYGLLVRGEDDTTIMIDERGVHNAGITDGAIDNNKVSQNANIDGTKLNINSVIREVNENGTESISGTKVVVGDKNLEVELKEQQNTITEHGQELSSQKSQIIAMEDKISLKVDSQKFTEETQNIKQSIGVAKQEAIEAASQDATNKANSAKDEAINSASQDASQKAEQALQNAKAYTNVEVSTVDKKLEKNTSEIKVLKDEISTKVSQADIDKSIANIKFSDVNMILNSGDFENKKHWSITNGEDNLVIENNVLVAKFKNYAKWGVYVSNDSLRNKPLDVAKDYTIVCKLKSSKNQTITFNICNGDSSDYVYGKELNITTEWQIFKFTFKPSLVGDERQFRFITGELDYDFDLYIEFVKMVEGKTSSDNWTPAPEDLNQVVIDNIDVVNEKISSVESKLTQDLNGVKVNVGSLESKTTQIESNVNVVKSELTGKIEDALQDSKEYSDELKNQAIDSSKEYVNVQINATNSKVSEVASGLDILKDKVESKVSQSDIDKSLVEVNDSIKVTQENINEVSSKVTQLKDSVNTEISSLKSKTQSLESDLGDKATKVEVQELNSQIAQQNVSLEGITNRVSQTESKTTQLETNISNVNKDLSGKITDSLNQSKEYTDEEVNKSKDEAINSSKDYTNSQIKVTNEKVSSVESSLDILKEKIESKVSQSDIDNSLIEVKDSIKVANSKIESVSSTVTQLKDSVTTEISSLKSKNQTIEANLEGKATKQEVQELNSQVAEQKVSLEGITNRVGQTESKTSQLESNITLVNRDLSSKIDENLETSKGYADKVATSKSEEAKNQAISSASQDATNKANSAKDEAINSSKEYTNVQINATNSKITGVESSLNVLKEKIESKVSQSDIDKSIANIQIGDRNYLVNSLLNLTTSSYLIKLVYFGNEKPKEGEEFTVSIKGNLGEGKESFGVYNSGGMISLARLDKKDSDGIYRKTFKWRIADSANTHLEIYALNNNVTVDSTIEWIKLEKGNKVSNSWMPAPEDTDSKIQDGIRVTDEKINQVSSTVTQLKDSVTTEISSLKSKTQTIESNLDGKASKSELQELNTQVAQQKVSIDGITNRVGQTETKTSQLEGSINEVNRDLSGKINSGVQSAKDFATGQANQAKNEAINVASQDATNKANQAKENANAYTNGQISSVNSKVSSVESSLNILKDKVETKVGQSEVDKSIANIKLGGRNYGLNTGVMQQEPYNISFSKDLIFKPGQSYTISLDFDTENLVEGSQARVGCEGSILFKDGTRQYIGLWHWIRDGATFKGRKSETFVIENKEIETNMTGIHIYTELVGGGKRELGMFKIEEGNKPTDWTPAPEDVNQLVADSVKVVNESISNVSSSVTQLRDSVNTQIQSINSKTQSLESSLDGKATKQEVSEVNNRVTSIDANLQGITQRVSNTEGKTSQLEQNLNGKASVQEVQNVKEQVSSVEVNLNGITNRVQSTENNVSRLDGQIQNAVTKSEFTEFKQNTDSFKFTVEQRSTMNNLVPNGSFEGYGRAWTCNGEFWAGPYAGYDFKGRFCGAIKNANRYNNEKYLMSEKCFRVKKNTTYTLNFKFALERNVDSMDAFVILSDSESTNYGQAIHMYNTTGGNQTNNWQEQCISKTFNTGNYEWVWLRFDHNGMKQDVNVDEWCWLYVTEVGVYEGDVGQVKWMPASGETYSSSFLLDREGFKANFDDGSYAYMGKNGFEWYNAGSGHTYHALTYVTSFDIPAGNPGRAYVKLPVEFTKRKDSLKWTVATRGYYYSTTGSFFPYHVHCSGFAPAYEEDGQLVCSVEGVCKIQNSNNSGDVQFRPLTAMLIAIA
ncbi:phage tail protein [Clostridium perfringens]|uniref:phage tail protein n=1 Tax=Clostridium perfringens TaxID=1502 RepID=UPI0039EAB521